MDDVTSPGGLAGLCTVPAYQERNAHVFPSVPSLNWFIRQNRDELVERGALVEIAGCKQVNAPIMDDVVLEVGKRRAAERPRSFPTTKVQAGAEKTGATK
jgi:hypothetical protein